jgi:hypothetical protein
VKHGDPLARVVGESNTYRDDGDRTYIDLRNRKTEIVAVAIISRSDKERVLRHNWCVDAQGYVVGRVNDKVTRLHRFLLPGAEVVDHANRNPLDNTRENLRSCTYAQNARNKGKQAGKTSIYHGVSFSRGRWAIYKGFPDIKKRFWGYFPTEHAAAVEYNRLVQAYGDKFTPVNRVKGSLDDDVFLAKHRKENNVT